MPKYVIERQTPDAGQMSREELQAISQRLTRVLHKMGPHIQWVSSIVADDTIYCTYIAGSEALLRQRAQAPASRSTTSPSFMPLSTRRRRKRRRLQKVRRTKVIREVARGEVRIC